jgi:hypothetical protein
VILQILASQAARITGVSHHWCLAWGQTFSIWVYTCETISLHQQTSLPSCLISPNSHQRANQRESWWFIQTKSPPALSLRRD